MGKSFRSGHSFPASAGFSGSSGKVATIAPHTRRMPKIRVTVPKAAMRAPAMAMPALALPKPKAMAIAPPPMIDPGAALQPPRSRKLALPKGMTLPLKKGGLAKC